MDTYVSNNYIKILPNVLSCVENNEDSDTEIIEIRIEKTLIRTIFGASVNYK